MKSFFRNLTLLALGLALWPASAQAAPPAQGDLVLGFQAQSGTGSNINVLVNLGPATALRDTPNGGTLASIDAALDAAYGNDWFTRTDLYFGVIANFSNLPSSGPGAGPATAGDPSSTVYVSRSTSTPGGSLLWSGLNASQLTSAATTHKGQINMMATLPFTGGIDQVSSSDPVKFANGWTAYNPFIAAGVQGAAFSVFGGGIQNAFGQPGSIVYVDIQRILPTNTGAAPSVPVPGTGVVIATLAITSTGDVVAASDFHELTLTSTAGGTVTGAVTGQVFADGAALSLTATANTGFTFTGWTGDFAPGNGNDNPLNVTMTADRTLQAVFAKDLSDPDGDGISTHDELVIHLTDPNVANTVPALPGDMQHEGSLGGLAGAEISAFDPGSNRLFVTCNTGLQVINLSNPAAPALITTINLSAAPYSAASNDVTSVAVRDGVVVATTVNANKEAAGSVVFMNASNAELPAGHLSTKAVGIHPDMVTFSPDGAKVLVANEGEYLNSDGGPGTTPGSVSIIDVVTNSFSDPIVTTVGFGAFDGMEAALRTSGVRIFAGQSASNDLEPEYIAVSPDNSTAYVTLQEANAMAILNLTTNAFTSIVPMGQKDFSTLLADFNDQDGVSALTTGNPVFGLYMPDAIAAFQQGGNTYYVMTNEGDDRDDFISPNETIRVGAGGYTLDAGTFPNATDLKTSARIGRLTVTNAPGLNGDTDTDTDIDEIRMLGGRSFTVRDEAGAIVYDSGDLIEKTIASYGKLAADGNPIFDDGRSDNKGPEPEGVAVSTVNGVTYAFVTLERSNGVMVFDISDLNNVSVAAFLRNTGDVSPEGVIVVPAVQSPNSKALVIVSNEVSNTISVFSFDQDTTTDTDGNGFTDFEEQQIDALPKQFMVGDTISNFDPIDLSFIALDPGQTLTVVGLPKGLTFNAATKTITGTIIGELGGEVVIQIKAGRTVVASIPFGLAVIPYSYLGSYEALIETTALVPLPNGKFTINITSPGAYTATLELLGQTRRSAKGVFADPPVGVVQTVQVPFAAFKAFPATTLVINLSTASDLVTGTEGGGTRTLRGFRLAKPGRTPLQKVTIAFSNDVAGDRLTTPGGTGYATGALNSKGQLPVKGLLGDAQALSTGLSLSQTNQAVVWVQPYKEKLNSFFGGIITIGDLGQPGRGGSADSATAGILWRKAALATEPAYPLGFGLGLTPLAVTGEVSKWIPVSNLEGLALSLGLNFREIDALYTAPPASVLPSKFSLRGKFALVRVAPANSVRWVGSAAPASGTFSGTLTLPTPATKTAVSGVLLQDASFGTQVGAGLIKIPITAPVKGSYQTSGIELQQ